ncbi:MAG: hypothetical protein R3F02_02225 [Thiolinea sp.]
MSRKITNAPIKPVDFPQRLALVQAEVRARAAAFPQSQQNHIRAKCWISWITRNVLAEVD